MTNYKLAKLNDCNNDLKKHWYVEYQFLHPEKKEWIRFRLWISNKLKTAASRREKASELVKQTNLWLKNGGNPFSAENVRGKLVTEALDTVLEKKKSYCRPRTYHTYHHVIKLFKQFLVSRKKEKLILDEMNFPIAQDFLDWCIIDHKIQNITHNYYKDHMSSFFNELNRRNQIDINPFKNIPDLPAEEPTLVGFKKRELDLLKTKLREEDKELWCCAGLIFYCALRPAEIMRLRVKDLFLEDGLIHIAGGQAKNKKSAWIFIVNIDFLEDLRSMNYDMYPDDYFLFARHLKPGQKEAAPTRIAGRWREWANENNIKRNIYDLKHTAAGMAADNGVPLRDLQLHFRHSALGITEQYMNRYRRKPGPGMVRYPSM